MAGDARLTRLLRPDEDGIRSAAAALRAGALVAFPTDTVYGVGAHVFLPEAVARIYEAKGRREEKPIPILLGSADDLPQVAAAASARAWRLARRFWPGALTIVLPSRPEIPAVVRAGGATVGVRVPDHPVVRALIAAVGAPLATTSANRSGWPSPTTAGEVVAQLGGRVEYVIEGDCPGGVESTVVDLSVDPPAILREGAIPRAELMAALAGPREEGD